MESKYKEKKSQEMGFATKAIHITQDIDKRLEKANGSYSRSSRDDSRDRKSTSTSPSNIFDYKEEYSCTKLANSAKDQLEKSLSALEDAKYALVYGSGLAAITAIFSLVKPGQHVVVSCNLYGGTVNLAREVFMRLDIEFTFTNFQDISNVQKAMKENTKMVFIETPTNPLQHVLDIEAIAKATHRISGNLLIVDNTFSSSYFQRPLDLDADLVVASLSKYVNGHSDVIMGAITTNCRSVFRRLKLMQNATGSNPSAFDCSQVLRGLKTLSLRMERHSKNATCVAKSLEENKCVTKVFYTGLKSHPQFELNRRQSSGSSGLVSFLIKGRLRNAQKFVDSLKLFSTTASFGGYESSAQIPYETVFANVPSEEKEKMGITDNLIRLSIGLEDSGDLIADLEQAIKASQKTK